MAPLNRRQLVQGGAAAAAAAGFTSAAPLVRNRPFGRSDEIPGGFRHLSAPHDHERAFTAEVDRQQVALGELLEVGALEA